MINFYRTNKLKPRNILKWSNKLNILQKEENYNEIEKSIKDYIVCYGLDIIKFGSSYHLRLLKTNIKRWNKITTKFNIILSEKNLFYYCLEIAFILEKAEINFSEELGDIKIIIINNDISLLIELAINNSKQSILDKLLEYDRNSIIKYFVNKYGEKCFNNNHIETLTAKTIFKNLNLI